MVEIIPITPPEFKLYREEGGVIKDVPNEWISNFFQIMRRWRAIGVISQEDFEQNVPEIQRVNMEVSV